MNTHKFTSSECQHGHHDRCRRKCPWCTSMCGCGCHRGEQTAARRRPWDPPSLHVAQAVVA